MEVKLYQLTKNLTINNRLFFKNEYLYIENSTCKSTKSVFLPDRTFIGTIELSFFVDLNKNMIEVDEDIQVSKSSDDEDCDDNGWMCDGPCRCGCC